MYGSEDVTGAFAGYFWSCSKMHCYSRRDPPDQMHRQSPGRARHKGGILDPSPGLLNRNLQSYQDLQVTHVHIEASESMNEVTLLSCY